MARVNGKLIAEVTDNDDDSVEATGILAMQLHTGPPMKAQFKDIRLQRLTPAHKPDARETLLATAALAWQLGERLNAHQPPLKAVGKITPGLPAEGPGARSGAKIAKLEEASFDLQKDLNQPKLWNVLGNAITVYLRARVPDGSWDSALISKRGNHDVVNFNLFSTDLSETPGPDIGFEMHTENGFGFLVCRAISAHLEPLSLSPRSTSMHRLHFNVVDAARKPASLNVSFGFPSLAQCPLLGWHWVTLTVNSQADVHVSPMTVNYSCHYGQDGASYWLYPSSSSLQPGRSRGLT